MSLIAPGANAAPMAAKAFAEVDARRRNLACPVNAKTPSILVFLNATGSNVALMAAVVSAANAMSLRSAPTLDFANPIHRPDVRVFL